MGVVEHISDRVAVMYLGRIAEVADRRALFEHQEHPYTEALMSAIPVPNPELRQQRGTVAEVDVRGPGKSPSGPARTPALGATPAARHAGHLR